MSASCHKPTSRQLFDHLSALSSEPKPRAPPGAFPANSLRLWTQLELLLVSGVLPFLIWREMPEGVDHQVPLSLQDRTI